MKNLVKTFIGTLFIVVALTFFMLFSFALQRGIKPNELITASQFIIVTLILSILFWILGTKVLPNKKQVQ